ncbi:hypothetical protein LCL97_21405 [Seohaeicola saemankumensis]|nr:hypothetical protein [Seohaeicola saemankumensis]MCA0873397.1 hypothetical protein [Seohaeicola saemankumensis]
MRSLFALALIATTSLTTLPARAEQVVFRCFFDWVCDPNTKCDHAGEDIRFRVDLETNSVERIGGNRLSEFNLLLGDRAITVLERPVSGGTVTTTLMLDGGDAVHSENLISGRELAARQYLGECTAF